MSNTVFLVWNKRDYFYEWESQCVRPYHLASRTIRILNKTCRILHINTMPGCVIKQEVRHADKIVMTDIMFDFHLYNALKKYCGPENIFLYYMNLISPRTQKYMDLFPEQTCSFDREDAERFGIGYRHLPYSGKIAIRQEALQYDTLFLGVEKGRESEIKDAASLLEKCGLNAKIMVVNSSNPQFQIPAYIHYPEYLEYVAKSKSILELNIPGQTSCTLRFLESLFLKKKLITNNQKIEADPYYDADNIFILGKDDLQKLPDFIAQPYQDKKQDLTGLTFEKWLQGW